MNRGTPVRTLRVDDELWMRLEDRAAGNGLTSSEYLRRLIARDTGVVPRPRSTHGDPRRSVASALDATERYLHRVEFQKRNNQRRYRG